MTTVPPVSGPRAGEPLQAALDHVCAALDEVERLEPSQHRTHARDCLTEAYDCLAYQLHLQHGCDHELGPLPGAP